MVDAAVVVVVVACLLVVVAVVVVGSWLFCLFAFLLRRKCVFEILQEILPSYFSWPSDPLSIYFCPDESHCPGGVPGTCDGGGIGPTCSTFLGAFNKKVWTFLCVETCSLLKQEVVETKGLNRKLFILNPILLESSCLLIDA